MNAERVVLEPRTERGAIETGAIADSGGGVLFGMPTRYSKGAAASTPAPGALSRHSAGQASGNRARRYFH